MMVDWLQGFVRPTGLPTGTPPVYDTGHVLMLSPGGELERKQARATTLEGSYDSRLLIRSWDGHDLFVSGNVVKHVQGHNLWGPDDAIGLFMDAGLRIRQELGLFPGPHTWRANGYQGPSFTRLDLTRSYRFDSEQEARAWIRDVAGVARTRHGGAVMRGDTVYYGKGSERWTFKVYHKGDELQARRKGHQLPAWLGGRDTLLEWSQGVVRFELTLRSKELAKHDVLNSAPIDLWREYFDRIEWNQNAMSTAKTTDLLEQDLPGRLRAAVALWRTGEDLRAFYPKKTYYRYRRQIMDATGIDISAPPPRSEQSTGHAALDDHRWDPEPLDSYPADLEQAKRQYKIT